MPKHVDINKTFVLADGSYFPCYCNEFTAPSLMYRVYCTEFTVQSSVGIISTEESDKPNKICDTSCTSCRVSLNDAEYEN